MAKKAELSFTDPRRSLVKTIEQLAYDKRTWEIFRDFCELSALTLANVNQFDPKHAAREKRYQEIRETYRPEEFARFPFAYACLVECMQAGFDDVLGSIFMELDLGSHWHGQFFTPYSLAKMMAAMTFDPAMVGGKEFIRVQEPAAGAGGMLIAMADAMLAAGMNPQRQMHALAVDVDVLCVHMTYVQLSIIGIPAIVVHGNTLSLEEWSRWYTPAHFLNLWGAKLRRVEAEQEAMTLIVPPTQPDVTSSASSNGQQFSLF